MRTNPIGETVFMGFVVIEQKGRSISKMYPTQALIATGHPPAVSNRAVRIDFHVHTNRSPEGIHGIAEIIAQAKRLGLDGIAVTDHNRLLTRRMAAQLSKMHNFLVIGGIEGGDLLRHKPGRSDSHRHWIGLNIDDISADNDIEEITNRVRDEGGLSIAPHPYARNGFRDYDTRGFDAVESLNGTRKDGDIDARGLPRVGGTDAHAKYMLGHTWTDVYESDGSLESVLESVRRGNCAPRGSRIPLWVIARFYAAVVGRYILREPCELLQNGGRQLRKYC